MLRIRFPGEAPGNPLAFIDAIETLVFRAVASTSTSTLIVAAHGTSTFTVTGSGFTYTTIPFLGTFPSGGTITSLTVSRGGTPVLEVTGALGMASVFAAARDELLGTDRGALERLFGSVGYDYRGKDNADVFRLQNSVDGFLLDPRGNDLVVLAGGNDNFDAGSGNDTMRGGTGNDSLSGSGGDDRIFGDAGDDSLYGGTGADRLAGGAGRDQLFGGAGNDVLTGGAGRDTFMFTRSAFAAGDRDRVTDFERGADKVALSAGDTFTGARFRGNAGDVRFVVNGSDGWLQIDTDGDRNPDATLVLVGVTAFGAADIIVL